MRSNAWRNTYFGSVETYAPPIALERWNPLKLVEIPPLTEGKTCSGPLRSDTSRA